MPEGKGIVPGLPDRTGAERDCLRPRQGIGESSPHIEHLAYLVHQLEAGIRAKYRFIFISIFHNL
jgi:hypothetical protein